MMAQTSLYNTGVTYRHLESKRFSAHLLHAIYLLWCSRLLFGFITHYFRNWTSATVRNVPMHLLADKKKRILHYYCCSSFPQTLMNTCCYVAGAVWNDEIHSTAFVRQHSINSKNTKEQICLDVLFFNTDWKLNHYSVIYLFIYFCYCCKRLERSCTCSVCVCVCVCVSLSKCVHAYACARRHIMRDWFESNTSLYLGSFWNTQLPWNPWTEMISCSIAPDMAMEHEIESLSVKKGENQQEKYTS